VADRVAPARFLYDPAALASFEVSVGRQRVRVLWFKTTAALRRHVRAADRASGKVRVGPVRYAGVTWGVEQRRHRRRTGLVALVTLAQNDPAILNTIAHEGVHVACRVLARRGVDGMRIAAEGGLSKREEMLATLVGDFTAAVNRHAHAEGLYRAAAVTRARRATVAADGH